MYRQLTKKEINSVLTDERQSNSLNLTQELLLEENKNKEVWGQVDYDGWIGKISLRKKENKNESSKIN